MILTGPEISKQVKQGRISIDPFDPKKVNPASYDLTLGNTVSVYRDVVGGFLAPQTTAERGHYFSPVGNGAAVLDSKKPLKVNTFKMEPRGGWLLKPGILYLMHTAEVISTDHYVPILDGKSSIGRLGICIHLTAGFGDPHFSGQYTLEVTAVHPVMVYPGMRFCQIRFHAMQGETKLYKGNYTGEAAKGPVPSRAYKSAFK